MEKNDEIRDTDNLCDKIKVHKDYSYKDSFDEVFTVKYDPSDQFLAYGCEDGIIRLLDFGDYQLEEVKDSKNVHPKMRLKTTISRLDAFKKEAKGLKSPITSLTWRTGEVTNPEDRHLVACSSSGSIYTWKPAADELLNYIKEDNEIYCTDYSHYKDIFATAGGDFRIRIYDYNTQEVLQSFSGASDDVLGHSNRIFSLKFHPNDSNILVSGGWDNLIFIWDLRKEKPVSHILGPNISGEAVDICGDHILAGSYNNETNLYLMSLSEHKITKEIEWYDTEAYKELNLAPPCVYSAQFSKPDASYFIAGGTARNEVRVFKNLDNFSSTKSVACIANLKSACLSIDCTNTHKNGFAFGCANGTVKCFSIQDEAEEEKIS
ncbi:unnamed protein product [Moneuplotes crassus]|uniref:Uncharacterized protein n=1 Tax=Euplotes crassus TaxID=5936 RepID=A0AAD1UIF1_EUPCR|nr:unnamed protein product [Moneuplotes crassus]